MHVVTLLQIINQIKMMHWQTDSYAAHVALGSLYDSLDELIDDIVETYSGKYGKPKLDAPGSINVIDISRMDPEGFLGEIAQYLQGKFVDGMDSDKDSDVLNLRDEMLAAVNKTRYLLRLK
jgi:hypothetical protein